MWIKQIEWEFSEQLLTCDLCGKKAEYYAETTHRNIDVSICLCSKCSRKPQLDIYIEWCNYFYGDKKK